MNPGPPASAAIDWINVARPTERRSRWLGLTGLPGKHGASVRYPGHTYRGVLAEDLARLRHARVRSLLLLVEDAELARLGDPQIVVHGMAAGVEIVRHPIPDGGVPASMRAMEEILGRVREAEGRGRAAVACMGGIGRSGLVAACALVESSWSSSDAIALVRRARHPQAVETALQEAFVAGFAAHLTGCEGWLSRSAAISRALVVP
jgi:protein-tyrosine phosphatase